jgi:hypothetical protein
MKEIIGGCILNNYCHSLINDNKFPPKYNTIKQIFIILISILQYKIYYKIDSIYKHDKTVEKNNFIKIHDCIYNYHGIYL